MAKRVIKNPIKYSIFNLMNLKIFWIFSIISMICLVGFLLLQIYFLSQNSKSVFVLQRYLTELSARNNKELSRFSPKAMINLVQLAQNLNFERIEGIHYIKTTKNIVLAQE